jgi:plastocyanin
VDGERTLQELRKSHHTPGLPRSRRVFSSIPGVKPPALDSRKCPKIAPGAWAIALVVVFASAAALPNSFAALPRPKAVLIAYDHSSELDGYHLEFVIGPKRRVVQQTLLYSSKCGADAILGAVPISGTGRVSMNTRFAPNPSKRKKTATLVLNARFTSSERLTGTFQVIRGGCDTGPRPFTAETHKKGAHSVPPNVQGATPTERAQAESLLNRSKQAAARFPSMSAAFRLGYVRHPETDPARIAPNQIFHLENCRYWFDGHALDPTRPEALAYWNVAPGVAPVLVALMFRESQYQPPPVFGGPIIRWHAHSPKAPTQMTHVWFTSRLESAYAPPDQVPFSELSYLRTQAQAPPAAPLNSPVGRTPSIRFGAGKCLGRGANIHRTVRIGTKAFARKTLSIPFGATVVWKWTGKSPRDLVATGTERFRSQVKTSGTFEHTFIWPGRTHVISSFRRGMQMTVRVHR